MRSWIRSFLSLWHTKEDLLQKIDRVRADNDVLHSQLHELRDRAHALTESLLDDRVWTGLESGLSRLVETLEYLDEEYPSK